MFSFSVVNDWRPVNYRTFFFRFCRHPCYGDYFKFAFWFLLWCVFVTINIQSYSHFLKCALTLYWYVSRAAFVGVGFVPQPTRKNRPFTLGDAIRARPQKVDFWIKTGQNNVVWCIYIISDYLDNKNKHKTVIFVIYIWVILFSV